MRILDSNLLIYSAQEEFTHITGLTVVNPLDNSIP